MTILVAVLAVLLGYIVKGVTGFGSVIVAMPLLVLVLAPPEAMVAVTGADLIGGTLLAWRARHAVRWVLLPAILVPMVLAQWVGTELLAGMDAATVRWVLGMVVGLLAVGLALRPVRAEGPEDRTDCTSWSAMAWAGVAGTAGGLMSGTVGAPGPPVVAWTRRYLSDDSARALLLWVFAPSSFVLVGMLLGKDLASPDALRVAAACVPAALAGGAVGSRVRHMVQPAAFGRLVAALLLMAAIALVVSA